MLIGGRRSRRSPGKGTQVVVRMQPVLLNALDKFIREQEPGILTRPDAVRMILADALVSYGVLTAEAPTPIKRDAN